MIVKDYDNNGLAVLKHGIDKLKVMYGGTGLAIVELEQTIDWLNAAVSRVEGTLAHIRGLDAKIKACVGDWGSLRSADSTTVANFEKEYKRIKAEYDGWKTLPKKQEAIDKAYGHWQDVISAIKDNQVR